MARTGNLQRTTSTAEFEHDHMTELAAISIGNMGHEEARRADVLTGLDPPKLLALLGIAQILSAH